MIFNGLDTT